MNIEQLEHEVKRVTNWYNYMTNAVNHAMHHDAYGSRARADVAMFEHVERHRDCMTFVYDGLIQDAVFPVENGILVYGEVLEDQIESGDYAGVVPRFYPSFLAMVCECLIPGDVAGHEATFSHPLTA